MTLVITNIGQLLPSTETASSSSWSILHDGAVVVSQERIRWVGPSSRLVPPPDAEVIDAGGRVVVAGLIDSHTHLIFAGDRVDEFEQRIRGASYEEIAARGGGIHATVDQVRRASKEQLKQLARRRLDRMLAFGITTVEVKSGYGLSIADEIKCLEVVRELHQEHPCDLVATFLGAHEIAREFRNDRSAYVRQVVQEMIPRVAREELAEFCDVFCERGVFSRDESAQILRAARDCGLRLKIHADEFSSLGGAELAAELGAVSADHLLHVSDAGIAALAEAGTVATLLPGTAFTLGLPYAPARRLIDAGVTVALATDCNPGSCLTENLPLMGAMACTQMRMTPAEVIAGMTLHAAAALDRSNLIGSIEVGKLADLVIFDVPDYRHLFYHFGVNHVWKVIKRGRVVVGA